MTGMLTPAMYGNDYRDEDADDYLTRHDLWDTFRVYYHTGDRQWRCRCPVYQAEGKCAHIVRYLPTETLKVSDRYL